MQAAACPLYSPDQVQSYLVQSYAKKRREVYEIYTKLTVEKPGWYDWRWSVAFIIDNGKSQPVALLSLLATLNIALLIVASSI